MSSGKDARETPLLAVRVGLSTSAAEESAAELKAVPPVKRTVPAPKPTEASPWAAIKRLASVRGMARQRARLIALQRSTPRARWKRAAHSRNAGAEVEVAPSVTVFTGRDSLACDRVAGALPCTYHPRAAWRATKRAC